MRGAPHQDQQDFPYWLLVLGALGFWMLYAVLSDPQYALALQLLGRGIWITLLVSVVGYLGACVIGMGLALMSLSRSIWLRQIARFYIEVIRGIPIMVLLLYVAFVLAPGIIWLINILLGWLGTEPIRARDFSLLWRAVIALVLAYSAFLAEIFRAGLQAVDQGQIEAAKALGLTPKQRFRHVVWPQAMRIILPPFGNDFIAMVKDSSLVAVLGVSDITQLAKVTAAGNFRYFETYNVAALIYLTMTIGLSLILRWLERRLRQKERR